VLSVLITVSLVGVAIIRAALRPTKSPDEKVKEIAADRSITSLDLSEMQVTDAGLKELAPLTNLTELHLPFTSVTDMGLKELAPLTQLTTLTLGGRELTDQTLRVLREINLLHAVPWATALGERPSNAEKVFSLNLSRMPVTDAGLKELAPLKHLASLNLRGTSVTDTGLKELAKFTNLAELDLSETKVTGAGLKELAPLKNLTSLNLRGTHVTETGVQELQKALPSCRIWADAEGKAIAFVQGFQGVVIRDEAQPGRPVIKVSLGGTGVTDLDLKELAPLTTLTEISLDKTQVTDRTLVVLREIKLLHALTQAQGPNRNQPSHPEDITILNLNDTKVTDAGLREVARLYNLTSLSMNDTKITDAGLKEIAKLKNLTTLDIDNTKVTSAGMRDVAMYIPGERRWGCQ